MSLPHTILDTVLTGEISLLSDGKTPSGMGKRPREGRAEVGPEGLIRDRQADLAVHGGRDKAILHYAYDHYASWRTEFGAAVPPVLDGPGAFGENLSSRGLIEADVCLGDQVRIGGVLLEITQGRQPCFKLNLFHGREDMAPLVRTTGRTGWYYRVLETGSIEAGDPIAVVERPHPEWTVARAHRLLWNPKPERTEIEAVIAIPSLADAWRKAFDKKLG